MAHTVTLTWTASPDIPSDSYNVYRGTSSGNETTLLNPTPLNTTTYVDADPPAGDSFYIVKSVQGALISVPSSEVSVLVPLQPPTNLVAILA